MSEFAPPWQWARMTRSQVKKYVRDMKQAQAIAQAKLEAAQASGELKKDEQEITKLEEKIKNLDNIA